MRKEIPTSLDAYRGSAANEVGPDEEQVVRTQTITIIDFHGELGERNQRYIRQPNLDPQAI